MQKVKPKKIPLRMCAGCGEMKPKKELVRVVRAPVREVDGVETGGEVSLDLTGRKPGRGAYVCRNPECLKKAQKKKALERSFEQPVPAEVYEALALQLSQTAGKEAQDAQTE